MRISRPVITVALVVLVVLAGCAGGVDTPAASGEAGAGTDETATTRATGALATDDGAPSEGTLEVHFINVGQSVSTLVVTETGETMLVDTGNFYDDGEYVLSYLERNDVTRIDHLVVSHADADHIGGNAAVIEHYETEARGIGAVYDPGIASGTLTYQSYLDAVERHDVTLYETRAGDELPLSGADVRVLGPPEPYFEGGDRNENSVVLAVTFGATGFLLTGDAEDDAEAYLVETYGTELRATVLKAGHHGSESSTGPDLLDAVRPRAVVISSAYDSRYGHPHEETLARLSERTIATYWTATHGTVVFVSDGTNVTVATQAQAPTAASSIRDGAPVDPGDTAPVVERGRLGEGGDANATPTPTPTATDTATATPTVTDGGDSSDDGDATDGRLAVAAIHADAAGDDHENLVDEYVVFENVGDADLNLGGWTVRDADGATYTFPADASLGPGDRVTVHTGAGTDTSTDRYWDYGRAVWNNGGDTVTVRDGTGTTVLEVTYGDD